MASVVTHIGTAHLFGIPATFTAYDTSGSATTGYIMPNLSSADIKHVAASDMTHAKTGSITGLTVSGEYLECTFELIPEGTSVANATTSGHIYTAGTSFTISGMPQIIVGPFADAWNVSGSASPLQNRWIYTDGGSSKHSSTGKVVQTVTLRRFVDITGLTGTVITV